MKLETLKQEYEYIKNHLEHLCESAAITEYTKCTLEDMLNKVVYHIAQKYPKVRKGVKDIMGGKVLDYEAKRILEQGIEQGIETANITNAKKCCVIIWRFPLLWRLPIYPRKKLKV